MNRGISPTSIMRITGSVGFGRVTVMLRRVPTTVSISPSMIIAPITAMHISFVSYKRRNNEFKRMKAAVPKNLSTGKTGALRAHTSYKDDEGAFWCFSGNGIFFKFFPAEDRTEFVGLNWDKGNYIPNVVFSPGKRYIYYLPQTDRNPVVQYDTKTGRKKVLAFIRDFYQTKYGYAPGSIYGIEAARDGESLFFYTGGGFRTEESGLVFRRPAMFHVHIPESERQE